MPGNTVTVTSQNVVASAVTVSTTVTVTNANAVVTANYAQQTQNTNPGGCADNGGTYGREDLSSDPSNNYQTGIQQCAVICDSDPQCQSFFYYSSKEVNFVECDIYYQPYNSGDINCEYGYTIDYYAAYNKQVVS